MQARFERSNAGEPIQSAGLPSNRIRQSNLMNTFIPGTSVVNFNQVDQFYTPPRQMDPAPTEAGLSQPRGSTALSIGGATARAAEEADRQIAVRPHQELDSQDSENGEDGFYGFKSDHGIRGTPPTDFAVVGTSEASSSSLSLSDESGYPQNDS